VVPIIVAESLDQVESPLVTVLRSMVPGTPEDIVSRVAQALARPRDHHPPPDWLWPEQRDTCSRLVAMLRRYSCALLADPVGTGKSYVALAVALQWASREPATVLAPAAIITQWRHTAARLGRPIDLWSHERISRGSLPDQLTRDSPASLVIIDESHHFRNPATRRYQCLAPALIGRAVLLLSATPLVNSANDLGAQLTLGTRDDALLPFGIPSIRRHLATAVPTSTALGELILASTRSPAGRPERILRKTRGMGEDLDLEVRCGMIDRLALSGDGAIAELIRGVMWRALASSDMALLAVLRRYRSLLLHARDASECGRTITRAELKSLVGDADQMVMWSLFQEPDLEGDLVIADQEMLDALIEIVMARSREADAKCRRLVSLVEDRKPTLVFTSARETVRYLRTHLPRAAWCTGTAAGIGTVKMARDDVLSWFRPGASGVGGPEILITTDVSAEGLDLQRAARVVHYDLPWTAVRMDQRNGRALRLGSKHDRVEVIRFEIPPPVEQRLGQLRVLARKRRLPGQAGIDGHESRAWHWREAMAAHFGGASGTSRPQYCRVVSNTEGVLAGFSLVAVEGTPTPRRIATIVGFLGPDGTWSEDPQVVARMMDLALTSPRWKGPGPQDFDVGGVAEIIRQRLKLLQLAQWSHHHSSAQARLIARLNRMATRAVHSRRTALLSAIERAISFVRRGHTSGEEMWIERLLPLSDPALLEAIRRCPEGEPTTPSTMSELLGIVVFTPRNY